MEGELSGEVVHATGVHEAQRVAHSFSTQHTIPRDWTNAPVGKRGSHDTSWLTGDLYGAQLETQTKHFTNGF